MKNTPFTDKHIALGAKMAEFAGYNMPISYTGINDEHAAVRKNAGIFDVSHMGEFILKGDKALDLIQRTTSNDASKLSAGKARLRIVHNVSLWLPSAQPKVGIFTATAARPRADLTKTAPRSEAFRIAAAFVRGIAGPLRCPRPHRE